MNHKFKASDSNPSSCEACGFDFMSHTNAATCDKCNCISAVEIWESQKLCSNCWNPRITSFNNSIVDAQILMREAKSLVEEAKDIDSGIRYNGDVFNAKVIANHKIKEEIFNQENLTEEQKLYEYTKFLADRYNHFARVIFKISAELHDANVEQIAVAHDLREYGNKVREEIREQIKKSDDLYTPAVINKPQVKAKVKVKTSAKDKMVQALMAMRNCSETEAILLIEQGEKKS